MEEAGPRPYALKAGEGWTYRYGVDFTVKAGELARGRRLAFVEYTTRVGESRDRTPTPTEDEIFYVLRGPLTFQCGDEAFNVEDGGFVFLPRGIEHGYAIRGDSEVHLLVVTSPADDDAVGGWGGFVADFEANGELRANPQP